MFQRICRIVKNKQKKSGYPSMWAYVKRYLSFVLAAALLMCGEVSVDLLLPDLMRRAIDQGILGTDAAVPIGMVLVLRLGAAMFVLTLAGGLCGSLNNVLVNIASQGIGNAMRKDGFRRCMVFSFQQMDSMGSGSLITRLTNDITQVQNFIAQFVRGGVRTLMMLGGSIGFLFVLDARFGRIALASLPLLVGCVILCLRRVMPLFPRMQEQLDRLNEIMQEDASGLRMIKACVRESCEEARFGRASKNLAATMLKTLLVFAMMNPVMNLIMSMVIVAIIYAGSRAGTGAATPGAVMAGITYAARLLNALLMLMMLFQNITRGYASWKRVRDLLQSKPAISQGTFAGTTTLHGQVELNDVSFTFPGAAQPALSHVSLCIRPGESVAVMGATGSGKTALLSLIPRYYDVSSGSVLVDGVDVRQYAFDALRGKIAFGLQKADLFSGTLKENITWACPDALPKDIVRAADAACLNDVIESHEAGMEMPVAERGMSFSGGQRQRAAIARMLLKGGEILLLDDVSSALDLKTEAQLWQNLRAYCPGTTMIIVAQRISTARTADRIVILEQGRIAGIGTHNELLQTCPAYQEICASQMGGGDDLD